MCVCDPNLTSHYLLEVSPEVGGEIFGVKILCNGRVEFTNLEGIDDKSQRVWMELGRWMSEHPQAFAFGLTPAIGQLGLDAPTIAHNILICPRYENA